METPPAASSRRMACWITGVGMTPRSMTFFPQARSAATTPSRIMIPLDRGSRPTITPRPGSRNVPNAEAKSSTCAAVMPVPTTPRNPTCEIRRDLAVSRVMLFEFHFAERLRHMKRLGAGGLPGEVLASRVRALAAVEIDPHLEALSGRPLVDALDRNAHLAVPDLARGIDAGLHLETGIPQPAFFRMRTVAVDIQIDPLALRRHFELFVLPDVLKIRANENLRYIPIPKLIGLAGAARIRVQM